VLTISPRRAIFGTRLFGLMVAAVHRDEMAAQKAMKTFSMLVEKSSKWKINVKKSAFHHDKTRCLQALYRLLELRLEQKEHATIWSVLKIIQKICVDGSLCQELLLSGLLLRLDKLFEFYSGVDELGPPEYARAKVVTRSREKPPFPQLNTTRPDAVEGSVEDTSPRPVLVKYTLARNALKMGNLYPRLSSLLYLMGEDYVDINAYRQLCDRNMMLLLIKDVRARCEKSRQSLLAPWSLPSRVRKQ